LADDDCEFYNTISG